MQVHILQLQGTGDDEYAYENAGVFATYEEAVERIKFFNEDYKDADDEFWKLDDNVRIETHDLIDNNWGY